MSKKRPVDISSIKSKSVEFREDKQLDSNNQRLETNEEEYTAFKKPENPRTAGHEPENEPGLQSTAKKPEEDLAYLKIKVPEIVSVPELHEHNLRYV